MSKGPKLYTVTKVVRMTKEDAAVLKSYAIRQKLSEAEAVRRLIRSRQLS